jgi:SNF2 family DNA or RNA helicase
VPSRRRLLLTGTPIQNTIEELWSLLHFVMPSKFETYEKFSIWISKNGSSDATPKSVSKKARTTHADAKPLGLGHEEEESIIQSLQVVMKPFFLRRTKADVQLDIPRKVVYSESLRTCGTLTI